MIDYAESPSGDSAEKVRGTVNLGSKTHYTCIRFLATAKSSQQMLYF